jgi:hypothetical protein
MARAVSHRDPWVWFGVGRIPRMNAYKAHHCAAGGLIGWVLAACLIPFLGMAGVVEDKFDVLQIGSQTFSNVTVTTKAKNYIFILHARGMTSIKTADLPLNIQQQLGYASAAQPKPATNTPAAWVKQEFAKMNVAPLKQLDQKWGGDQLRKLSVPSLLASKVVFIALGIMVLLYLFYCYCCQLICRKTGNDPGVLIWVPVLQLLPLLRAAGMSGWWLLAYCVPLLNIVAQVLWSFNIAKARGKSAWVGIFLLLPITSFFAFLYLAFSDGAASEEEQEPEPKIMTLEAA